MATEINHLALTCEIRLGIPGVPEPSSTPPQGNDTLPDGTTFPGGGANSSQDCWQDPVEPPIPSDSSKYGNGSCQVCVSQSLPDVMSWPTIGSRHDYEVRIRDSNNHDMGSVNKTLAAYGGQTGDLSTVLNMTVGGKQFNLWSMQEPEQPAWAAVYMKWGEPGPVDPFAQPQMLYSALEDNSSIGKLGCGFRGASSDDKRVYFQCGFDC